MLTIIPNVAIIVKQIFHSQAARSKKVKHIVFHTRILHFFKKSPLRVNSTLFVLLDASISRGKGLRNRTERAGGSCMDVGCQCLRGKCLAVAVCSITIRLLLFFHRLVFMAVHNGIWPHISVNIIDVEKRVYAYQYH